MTLKDGAMLITNEREVRFDFSISRNRRVMAVIRYRPNISSLIINNNWLLTQDGVQNRAIHENPNLNVSPHLNIESMGISLCRIDIKINESSFACCVFTDRDLILVHMNGNHLCPRLSDFITQEAGRLPLTQEQVAAYMVQNPDEHRRLIEEEAQQLVLTEQQVEAFMEQNPDFAKRQADLFFERNRGFANMFGKQFFQNLMKDSAWLSQ